MEVQPTAKERRLSMPITIPPIVLYPGEHGYMAQNHWIVALRAIVIRWGVDPIVAGELVEVAKERGLITADNLDCNEVLRAICPIAAERCIAPGQKNSTLFAPR